MRLLQFAFYPILMSFLYQCCYLEKLELKILFTRSRCDHCLKPLGALNLIPIMSFLWQKGRSQCCAHPLHPQYVIGEVLSLLCGIYIVFVDLPIPSTLFIFIFFLLLTLALFDSLTLTIPVYFLSIFLFACAYLFPFNVKSFFISFICLHIFFIFLRSTIGYGDILIFLFLSLFLPTMMYVYIVLFTFFFAGGFALFYAIYFKKLKNIPIPLIPFVFITFCFVMYFYEILLTGGLLS